MVDSRVEVRESVIFLNVSVISFPAAVNRLLYVCIVTEITLSIVESTPQPKMAVVEMKKVEEVSGG